MADRTRPEELNHEPLAHALSREHIGFTIAGYLGLARGLHQAGIIVAEQAAQILETIAAEYDAVGRALLVADVTTLQNIGEAAKVLRDAAQEVREG